MKWLLIIAPLIFSDGNITMGEPELVSKHEKESTCLTNAHNRNKGGIFDTTKPVIATCVSFDEGSMIKELHDQAKAALIRGAISADEASALKAITE